MESKRNTAQNKGKSAKSTRAQERKKLAELEAQAQARERKQASIIGISVCAAIIAIIIAIVAVVWAVNRPPKQSENTANHNSTSQSSGSKKAKEQDPDAISLRQARTNVGAVKVAPEHSNSEGGFLLSKDGLGKPVKNAPTVAVYMDLMCPACASLDQQLAPNWSKLIDAGQLNLEIHPNGFLDATSTDNYSTRAAAAVAYVADKDPSHALAFIQNLYDPSFKPKEGNEYTPISDDAIKGQATKAGVSEEIAAQAIKGDYTKWIQALATYTPMRPSLQHPDGAQKGEMTTPTVTINGEYWDYGKVTATGTSLGDAFNHAIGIKSADIGVSGKLPSIGSAGKPKA